MKKIVLSIASGLMLFGFVSCGNLQKATTYNNELVTIQTEIVTKVLNFSNKISTFDSATAQQKRAEIVTDITSGMAKAEKLHFDGDKQGLKDNFIALLKFYKKTYEEDYTKLIGLTFQKNPTTASQKEAEAIVEKFSKEEEAYDAKFQSAQAAFAKANNMQIQENSLQKKIDAENNK